jgi:hypothetical protein
MESSKGTHFFKVSTPSATGFVVLYHSGIFLDAGAGCGISKSG